MQQTDKYKLDLIEKTDTFSPDPLNGNMEKVEGALAALQTAVDGKAPASLEGRVAALELKKVVAGTYVGDGTGPRLIDLGFTPTALILEGTPSFEGQKIHVVVAGGDLGDLRVTENGFHIYNSGTSYNYNTKNQVYRFLALG